MLVINSVQLKEKIIENNLIPLEVSTLEISNQIYLNINNIDDFLKFVSRTASDYVYFYYTYYKSDEYIIPKDWYSEYSKEFKDEVKKHNGHIKSLDFTLPKGLTLFILQNGTFVGIKLQNPWLEGFSNAEETIEVIENMFFRETEEIHALQQDQQKKDEHELRDLIFIDPEFRLCKNQELRYWYLIELLNKEDMRRYEYLVQPFGIPHNGKIKLFMDKTWMLYKERQK